MPNDVKEALLWAISIKLIEPTHTNPVYTPCAPRIRNGLNPENSCHRPTFKSDSLVRSLKKRWLFRGKSQSHEKNPNPGDFKSDGIFAKKVWDPNPKKNPGF